MTDTLQPKKKRGGARPGTGPKKGQPHSGQFQKGRETINWSKNKWLRDALLKILEQPAGTFFVPQNNAEMIAFKLYSLAMTKDKTYKSDVLKAIQEIADRTEGKSKPSSEELDVLKDNKKITIVLPNVIPPAQDKK